MNGWALPIVSTDPIVVFGKVRQVCELEQKMYLEPGEFERPVSVGPLATLVGGHRAALPDLSEEEHKAIHDWAHQTAVFLDHLEDFEFLEATLTPEEREAQKTQLLLLQEAAKYNTKQTPVQNLYEMQTRLLNQAKEYNASFPALGNSEA